KVVMVSGAGGSIGSELCRQIVDLAPSQLILVELSEFSLYRIHTELLARTSLNGDDAVEIVPLLASVQDTTRMGKIFARFRTQTIYHAAAYKHVPLVEYNGIEAIKNNAFGTRICAELAAAHGAADFVLVSTDKAVRPTNIMGATKR